MERIFALIDEKLPVYRQFWKDICTMETPSDDKEALDAQSAFIARFCEARGFAVTVFPFPEAGDCLVVEPVRDAPAPEIAMLAHLDTVHAHGAFGEAVVTERDGVLYGPGVIDCKGGAAIALLAAEALRDSGMPFPPVRVVLTTDEEVSARFSGAAGIAFIKDMTRGCRAVLNCETGRHGALTVGRKGIIRMRLTVHGKAAHAGNAYFAGVSAVREAAYQIIELEKLSNPDGVTYNCGVVRGGEKANIIPETCIVEIDARVRTAAEAELAKETVRSIAATAHVPGSSAEVEIVSFRPPMAHTGGNDALFETVRAAAAACGQEDVVAVEKGGGSDSAYTVELGIPTVCAMGAIGLGEHTDKEQAEIASLSDRARLLAASILRI